MCTIVVLNQIHPSYPVIIAANREELMHRGATGPKLLDTAPRMIGGQDEAQGGTWMGATADGFFAGITNQYGSLTLDTSDQSKLSRGALVMDILRTNDVDAAITYLQELDPRRYREFNLLFGDSQALWVAYGRNDAEAVTFEQVPTGIHVLPNDRLDAPENRKVKRACSLAESLPPDWPASVEGLQALLADHHKPSFGELEGEPIPAMLTQDMFREMCALCIHTPGYGTRSSTIVALQPRAVSHYLFADGAPCTTPFADVTSLF